MEIPINGKGGEWKTIINQNRWNAIMGNKWDFMKNLNGGLKGEITLSFFTDFNDGWEAKDLF